MYKEYRQADPLVENRKNGLTAFEFPAIGAFSGVQHAIFTRQGGFSSGAYSSLNVGFGVGDSDDAVVKNREQISGYFKDGLLVFANQVHGTGVCVLSRTRDCREITHVRDGCAGDAMITNVPGLSLVIQVADCQAVMIYDPENHVVANIHAGWRGNVQNVIGATLNVMKEKYHSDPARKSRQTGRPT